MKRVALVWLVLLLFALKMVGQTPSTSMNNLLGVLGMMDTTYQWCYRSGDYRHTIDVLNQEITLCDDVKLSATEMDEYRLLLNHCRSYLYYNLSCAYALNGQKKLSIKALQRAVDYGYHDYQHVKSDPDLNSICGTKGYGAILERLKSWDKLLLLQNSTAYIHEQTDTFPVIHYQSSSDVLLQRVRSYFNLDSVAGNGNELSKIENLLHFVHNTIRHDGSHYARCEANSIGYYEYYKSSGQGINCRQLAMMLNECYLSMGIPSRYVTCLPKDSVDMDCHVINSVYSSELHRWIWVDPTFNAMVRDENGELLGIEEVRSRLIDDRPLVLNEDANWNNESKSEIGYYLYTYMAKNLYWLECAVENRFGSESGDFKGQRYVALLPPGFEQSENAKRFGHSFLTHDAAYFWQLP